MTPHHIQSGNSNMTLSQILTSRDAPSLIVGSLSRELISASLGADGG